jgi:mediator of RNA polymerase II transcription subunit 18
LVEESYCWWLEGIEYSLTRVFMIPPNADLTVPQQIPNLTTLEPVGNLWILYVRAKVDSSPAATMPDRVKQAQAQLVQVREQFKGVFDFPAYDRRCHDTRAQVSKGG